MSEEEDGLGDGDILILAKMPGGGGGLASDGGTICKNLGCVTCECKYLTLPFFWDQKNLGCVTCECKYMALGDWITVFTC